MPAFCRSGACSRVSVLTLEVLCARQTPITFPFFARNAGPPLLPGLTMMSTNTCSSSFGVPETGIIGVADTMPD